MADQNVDPGADVVLKLRLAPLVVPSLNILVVIEITTPKVPGPPPLIAQCRSACFSGEVTICCPSGVTTSHSRT